MAASLATLSIDLVARLAKLEDDLGRAARLNRKTVADIEAKWSQLTGLAGPLGAAIGGAFSASAIVSFTRETINAIDALNDARDATGSTIENLSGLEEVARRNGGTLDEVTGILVKFNGVLQQADGKNEVSRALQAIALDAGELRKLDPAEALLQTAKALSQYEDDGEKARLVQVLFGKSIKDAAPLLNDLAEAGRLNATVTAEQARQAEIFNKQIAQMQTNLGNISRGALVEVLPAINGITQEFAAAAEQGALLNKVLVESLKFSASPALYIYRRLNPQPEPLKLDSAAGAGRGFVNPDVVKPSISFPVAPSLPVQPRGQGGVASSGGLSPSIPQDLADALARLNATDTAKLARLNEEMGRLAGLIFAGSADPRLVEALQLARQEFDAIYQRKQALAEQSGEAVFYGPELSEEMIEARNDLIRDTNDLLASTPTAQAERLTAIHANLDERLRNNLITLQQYKEAVDKLDGGGGTQKPAVSPTTQRLQDAVGDTFEMGLRGNFENIGKMWDDLLADMAIKAARADLERLFFNKADAGPGLLDLGTGLLNLFGIPGFASGGDHAGGVRIVGERGPELEFTGPSRIVNASRTRDMLKGGRSERPQLIINVAAGVGRAEVYEAVQRGYQAAQADARALMRARDRGQL